MSKSAMKSYELIAIEAGRRAGMTGFPPACEMTGKRDRDICAWGKEAVANEATAPVRQEMVVEFERRLCDPMFSLEDLAGWFRGIYGHATISGMHRARAACLAGKLKLEQTVALADAVVKQIGPGGDDSMLKASGGIIRQLVVQALCEMRHVSDAAAGGDGEGVDAGRLAKLTKALVQAVGAETERDLAKAKLRELEIRFDEATKAAKGKRTDGTITESDLAEIRKQVLGVGA